MFILDKEVKKLKHLGKKMVHTFEISELDRLMLMGLLSMVIDNEHVDLDFDASEKIKTIIKGLMYKEDRK